MIVVGHDDARVEEGWGGRAVGDGEGLARSPGRVPYRRFEAVIGLPDRRLRLGDAVRIFPAFGAEAVDDGLGDVHGDEAVEEAVPDAGSERLLRVCRDE